MSEYISQELAQSLHDKGFRAKHKSVWFKGKTKWHYGSKKAFDDKRYKKVYARYTFTELWAVLPNEIRPEDETRVYLKVLDEDVRIGYYCAFSASWLGHRVFLHESPAEAAGLMVEWLIDNGHEVTG